MKYAADFRSLARDALRGKWLIAVIAGLIASLLGGTGSSGPEVKLTIEGNGAHANLEFAGQTIFSTGGGLNPDIAGFLLGSLAYIALAAIAMAVVYFVLGSVVELSYARFQLSLVDREEITLDALLAYFAYWKTAAIARLLRSVYTLLWSLLLVIPGIMASYSYAMTGYILAEHPELSAQEAIALSRRMMAGNRWRLFCLQLSFIGWMLLCSFTFGIGNLFLRPYQEAATAVFYREVSRTERIPPL